MNVYRRLLQYLHPYRFLFIASLVGLAVGSLLDGFTMILLIPFLRSLFGQPSLMPEAGNLVERAIEVTVGGLIQQGSPEESLLWVVLIVMAGLVLKNAFFYAADALGVKVREGIVRDMRDQLYARLQRLPLGFFDRNKTGQLVARVFSDTNQTKEIVSHVLAEVLKHAVSLITFVIVLFAISWKLTLLALVVAPLFLGFLKPMLWRLRKGFRGAYDAQGELTSLLQETASGARLVKAYGAEEFERKRFEDTNRGFFRSLVRAERIRMLSSPLSEVLGALTTMILVWVGAQLVFGGELSAEAFITFLTVSLRVQSPLKAITTLPARAQSSLAAAERFFEILDTESEPLVPRARVIESFRDGIAYEDVWFSYDGQEEVLRGIDFQVPRGHVVALVGPSGAGKSTIVDLLPRFYEPDRGRITIDGIDIREIRLDSLRELMGVVSQETVIFHDSVRSNIAYGEPEAYEQAEIEAAARAANADDFIRRLPEGYETVLGDRGVRLSGGQRQRISIARAILRDPPILIFDEATSALDTESERLVQGAIDRLLANRTVVVIAHRLSTVQGAHRILVIDDGRVVEAGRHEELLSRGGLYRRLYEMQFGDPSGPSTGGERSGSGGAPSEGARGATVR